MLNHFNKIRIILGITSPPYRRTLWEWFEMLIPHLPQCCQRTIRERSKSIRAASNTPKHITEHQQKTKRLNEMNLPNRTSKDKHARKESISLVPR
jgi:hypothetical protein